MIPTLLFVADMRTANLSATTEARLRLTDWTPSAEWMVGANGALGVTGRRWQLNLSYSPFFLLQDIGLPDTPASPFFYHTAQMSLTWQGRFVRLSLSESGSHGFQNTADLLFQAQPGMAQPAVNVAAKGGTIQYVQSLSTLSAEYTPSMRWRLGAHANLSLFGGVDEHAREFLPFQYGPSGGVLAAYQVSRLDGVFVQVDGGYSRTQRGPCLVPTLAGTGTMNAMDMNAMNGANAMAVPLCEPDNFLGTAVAGWQRHLSAVSDASLGAGAGATRAHLEQNVPYDTHAYPSALASYQYHLKKKHDERALRVDGGLGPVVDVRSGAIDYRVQLTGIVNWKSDPYVVTASFGTARSLQLPGTEEVPSTLVFGTSHVDYKVNKNVLVGGGLSIVFQHQDAASGVQNALVFAGDTTSFLLSFGLTVLTTPTVF